MFVAIVHPVLPNNALAYVQDACRRGVTISDINALAASGLGQTGTRRTDAGWRVSKSMRRSGEWRASEWIVPIDKLEAALTGLLACEDTESLGAAIRFAPTAHVRCMTAEQFCCCLDAKRPRNAGWRLHCSNGDRVHVDTCADDRCVATFVDVGRCGSSEINTCIGYTFAAPGISDWRRFAHPEIQGWLALYLGGSGA